MALPNYFLADCPPEAEITPGMLEEACRTLRENRGRFLAHRTTESLAQTLGEVAAGWLERDNPFRQLALEEGPVQTGFSRSTLARGIDAFFRPLTAENWRALVAQDLGHPRRLDRLSSAEVEGAGSRAALATAPEFLVHVAAGNLPNPAWMSLLIGLLARSAQFMKCARGSSFFPRLLAHSIRDADPKLGACIEIAEWKGGTQRLEEVLHREADALTATGSDETLAALRREIPPGVRFLGYGHRVSFAYVAADQLRSAHLARVVRRAADDVTAWNQLGCLSPHVIYVQDGAAVTPEAFAAQLAAELAKREEAEPRGPIPMDAAATIASRRSFYEVRAANSPDTRLWTSPHSTAWTVVYEAATLFQPSCLNRFIYVKAAGSLEDVLRGAESVRGRVSTVGLAVSDDSAPEAATALARWGATRVCTLGRMQEPPLLWRHDGRPALADLVTWTDWETGGI